MWNNSTFSQKRMNNNPRTPDRSRENADREAPSASPREPGSESLTDRFREWRLALNMDGEAIAKGTVCALLIVVFSLIQTTLFTRFRPFGAVPDLILPLVIAIAMTERERWGAVVGLIAAFVIESLGGSRLTLLPLLYMPSGYVCGLLTIYYFRDSAAVRALYTGVSSAVRAVFTFITLAMTVSDISLATAVICVVLPEFAANLLFAVIPHAAAYFALRPFNKSRDAKVQ